MLAGLIRFLCQDICGKDHLFDPPAEVPVLNDLVAVVFVLDDNIGKTCLAEKFPEFRHGNRSGYSTAVGIFVFQYLF